MKTAKNLLIRIASLILCLLLVTGAFPVCVSASGNEARVEDTEYATLSEAVSSAPEGATVVLLCDASLSASLDIGRSLILTSDGAHTVSFSSGAGINVVSGGMLTLYGDITVSGSADRSAVEVNGGTFNLRSGAGVISNSSGSAGAVNAVSGAVNLMGGRISGSGAELISVSENADIRLSGDISFEGATAVSLALGKYIEISSSLIGSGIISVKPATREKDTVVASFGSGVEPTADSVERFVISGGSAEQLYLIGNCICIQGESVKAKVRYSGAEFFSIQEALDAVAGTSGTLELIDDVVVNDTVTVSGKNITLISDGNHTILRSSAIRSEKMFSVLSGATLSIGTSGGTITVSGEGVSATMPAFSVSGNLTVGPCAVICNNTNTNPNIFYQGVCMAESGGTVTMTGGTFRSNNTINGTVLVYGGTFNMSGGAIQSNKTQYGGGVYVSSGTFSMSGGTITANVATACGGSVWNGDTFILSGKAKIVFDADNKSDVYLASGKVITVYPEWAGATDCLININPESSARDTHVCVAPYGNFTAEMLAKFTLFGELSVANALHATDNFAYIGPHGTGAVTVYVGDVGFTSLQEAFNTIPCNGVQTLVTITGDMVIDCGSSLMAGQNILLRDGRDPVKNDEYSSRTVKRDYTFDGSFISVPQGATLTISSSDSGKLIFDGSGAYAMNSVIFNLGVLVMERNVTIRGNNLIKTENLASEKPSFSTGGAVFVGEKAYFTMCGGVISQNYASEGGGVCVINGTFIQNGGLITSNSAIYGAGVCVIDTLTDENRELTVTTDENGKETSVRASSSLFEMNGGEITSNKASANEKLASVQSGIGGGVCVGNGATFTFKGGKLAENAAENGNGVAVGMPRDAEDEAKTVPIFRLLDGASFSENDDVYLTLTDDSTVEVTAPLTAINEKAPLKLAASSTAAQNSILLRFALDGKNETENRSAAKEAVDKGVFTVSDSQKDLYSLALSGTGEPALVNTYKDSCCCYAVGREYDGLPKYISADSEEESDSEENEEKDKADSDGKEKTETDTSNPERKEIEYSKFAVSSRGIFSSTYELYYHAELYTEMTTALVGAFPKGTAITMVDSSSDEPSVYYYIVTGKETVSDYAEVFTEQKNKEDEDNEEVKAIFYPELISDLKTSPEYIEIPLTEFVLMGTNDKKYSHGKSDKKTDEKTDKKSDDKSQETESSVHEKLTFVVDFSKADKNSKTAIMGDYSMLLSHRYKTEDGRTGDISYNLGQVKYTVTEKEKASVSVATDTDEDGKLILSYSLTSAALGCSYKNAVAVFELDGGFPEGSAITDGENSYPVISSDGVIAVALPKDEDGNIILRDRLKLEVVNYLGNGIPNYKLKVRILPSHDGCFESSDETVPDAESAAIPLLLPAKDIYSVKVENSEGKKPVYTEKELKDANSISFTLSALTNNTSATKVVFKLEKELSGEYETVPLSTVFEGFNEAGSGAVAISPGQIVLGFNSNAKTLGGTYRMVFTVGDKSEYIKLEF